MTIAQNIWLKEFWIYFFVKAAQIKSVPLNFVVNTVLYYNCVYYEIKWNRRYQLICCFYKTSKENNFHPKRGQKAVPGNGNI